MFHAMLLSTTPTPTDFFAGMTGLAMLMGFFAFCIIMYFLPSLIARGRGKANLEAIFWLNFLAGWTFVGWVVSLVWALSVDQRQPQTEVR
jgi:Superinfection immunity protein